MMYDLKMYEVRFLFFRCKITKKFAYVQEKVYLCAVFLQIVYRKFI